jgi:hypothetical protein
MMKAIAAVLAVSAMMAGSALAADKLSVKDSTGNNNVFAVDATGITTITNKSAADTTKVLEIKDLSGASAFKFSPDGYMDVVSSAAQFGLTAYAGDASGNLPNKRPNQAMIRYRGTAASPLVVKLNDKLGTFGFSGYDGTYLQTPALLESFVDGTPTATTFNPDNSINVLGQVPSRLSIVTGSNATLRAERLVVKADGKVGIGTATPAALLHSTGSTILGSANAAVADVSIGAGQCNMWINEATNALSFRCKYSDGTTVKTATVPLN